MCRAFLLLLTAFVLKAEVSESDAYDGFDDLDDDFVEDEIDSAEPTPYAQRPGSVPGDDDEIYYDDDEFEGFRRRHPRPTKRTTGKSKAQTNSHKTHYYPEYAAGIFIFLYVINFILGQRTNEKIARRWIESHVSVFESQFYALGDDTIKESGKSYLVKDSQSCFKMYASGRRFCHGILVTLELVKRHDIFSMLLSLVDLSTTHDEVTLEVPMDEDMDPFIFAVLKKKHEKRLLRAHKDLKEHAKYKVTSKSLPGIFSVCTDCPELESVFLREEKVIRTLTKHEDLFISLHITDEGNVNFLSTTKILRCKFRIPSLADMERCRTLVTMAIHFIDLAASHRLSAQARQRALRDRRKWADEEYRATHAQRQEALVHRKEELKRRDDNSVGDLGDVGSRRKESSRSSSKKPRVKVIR